jgi:DNA-binding NarL/FixJ family response regulator
MLAPTVLVVDDHAAFRQLVGEMLRSEGFEVVAEACDGAGGIAAARRLHPDLVLLDVQLPDMDGFDVARALAGGPSVVLTSSHPSSDFATDIGASGALGFISKDELTGAALHRLLRD